MPFRSTGSALPLAIAAGLIATALLLGCSDSRSWRTQALSADFPSLGFELISGENRRISEAAVEGKVTLLYFGYLSCPDVCPTTMATLNAALKSLPEHQRDQVRVLFVSVDPERDDPQRVADYAAWFGPQFIGATAEPERVRRLANRYGTSFQHFEKDKRVVIHGGNVLAFDRDGRARLMIRHDDGSEAIAHDLKRLITS